LLVLASPVLASVVKVFGDWLQRRPKIAITIKTLNGAVLAENVTGSDLAKLSRITLIGDESLQKRT
jgi:hypothetical protein